MCGSRWSRRGWWLCCAVRMLGCKDVGMSRPPGYRRSSRAGGTSRHPYIPTSQPETANEPAPTRVDIFMKNSWTGGEAALATAGSVESENLAVAVHRCEPGAFERLIDRFEAPLFSYAESVLQNRFDAQEVVQDALLRAHRALTKQYDEQRCETLALRPWLFRTVRNLSLNKRRSKRTKLERPLEEFDDGRMGPFVNLEGS